MTSSEHVVKSEMRRTFFGSFSLKTIGVILGGVAGGLLLRKSRVSASSPLRPPGATSEEDFLAACIRCTQCVEACPIDVLHISKFETGVSAGTPYLVARDIPCDLCKGRDQMECIAVCPTDALSPLHCEDVRMGKAVINQETCLPWVGVSCKACWHACPFPSEAIVFDELGRTKVVEDACVGCGLCEHVCLTDEAAIKVIPQALWNAGLSTAANTIENYTVE